jgi:hypothetical protein
MEYYRKNNYLIFRYNIIIGIYVDDTFNNFHMKKENIIRELRKNFSYIIFIIN